MARTDPKLPTQRADAKVTQRREDAKVTQRRDDAPLADADTTSVAGEEDPGASLDTAPVSPAAAPAPPPDRAGTSRSGRPRRA